MIRLNEDQAQDFVKIMFFSRLFYDNANFIDHDRRKAIENIS